MDTTLTPYEALQEAVRLAGGQSAMARICDKKQPSVWKWLQSSKRLPAEHVLAVEAATGVSKHLLRPDIYPIEQSVYPTDAEPPFDDGPYLPGFDAPHQSNRGQIFDRRRVA